MSIKWKENIKPMEDQSSPLMQLYPVTFTYKQPNDNSGMDPAKQWGLIAEQVADVFPEIVVFDHEGQPEAVKYEVFPAILLNELQKLTKRVAELEAKLKE